jgi:hypothetical protein
VGPPALSPRSRTRYRTARGSRGVTISWGTDEIAIDGDLLAILEDAQDLTDLK